MFVIKNLVPSLPIYSRACVRSRTPHSSLVFRRYAGAYEGIPQTHATILNKNVKIRPTKRAIDIQNEIHMIDTYSQQGFRLTDDSFVYGPMVLFKKHAFCWNVTSEEDIDEASLEFFCHLVPPIDLLVVGYGDLQFRHKLNKNLHSFAAKNNFHLELTPTIRAVATFNLLVGTRNIAGAFLPPLQYRPSDDDYQMDKKRLRKWRDTHDPDGSADEDYLAIHGAPRWPKPS